MKASPFWYLAMGLGFAFLVTSGRAGAIYSVLTSPIKTGLQTPPIPGTTPGGQQVYPTGGTCPTGYILDTATHRCIRVTTT